ncbi:TPA: hypothetical protein ACSPLY_005333 [Pseudomonas aeruginosa]|uniref:hypothetical protein n=1 Tax=Pseudomonas aeruginosa TaxID=287 RepID=UPI000F52AB0A|nr:hypothetical protein [Pseudomonas aeruginosa]RUI80017.1 hypothetical protein IPC377_29745 [Pseudomonas aeruginosa]HBO3339515.1 hypothetical protein [Pseudomonas aeruginosa]HBO3725181.1 hypothetical protein [Pseudomonas aeruginosa]HBO4432996.1 hypothetical protein [Pseudomonas aeruginosa]
MVRQGRNGVSDSETLITPQQGGRQLAAAPGESRKAVSESETAGNAKVLTREFQILKPWNKEQRAQEISDSEIFGRSALPSWRWMIEASRKLFLGTKVEGVLWSF